MDHIEKESVPDIFYQFPVKKDVEIMIDEMILFSVNVNAIREWI